MFSKNQYSLLVLLLSIVILKSISSIFYIEDIDSLRFALSVYDEFDLSNLQPHFPGYPVFCFFAKFMYLIIGNLGLSFSIVGSISLFLIIYFSLLITNFKITSKEGLFTIFIILFNPMIFLLSSRYMPDLMGLSIYLASFYFLTSKSRNKILFGAFLSAVLFGVRLSYFPLIIIPLIACVYKISKNDIYMLCVYFLAGIGVWLFPMVYMTGLGDLIDIALKQSVGHFSDYGGTFITEDNWILRFKSFIHTFWADGLGGYWIDRSSITLISSSMIFLMLPSVCKWIMNELKNNNKIKILLGSALLYFSWIMMFQNVVYKSRHVLPIVFVFLILLSLSQPIIFKRNLFLNNIAKLLLVFSLGLVSFNLSWQHKNYTSIHNIKEYLISDKYEYSIASTPLINFYLKSTGVNRKYYNVDDMKSNIELNSDINYKKILMIGDFRYRLDDESQFQIDSVFYHNPYMNRMWSTINVYSND